jgi:acetyl esterase/lipase
MSYGEPAKLPCFEPTFFEGQGRRSEVCAVIAQAVRWLVCSVLLFPCPHVESDMDRNKAAQPMTDLVVTRNLAYEPGDRHSLDVYVLRATAKPRPVIVYIYGGAWAAGSKEQYAWVGAALARRGFVAVVPDYRIYPQAHWPMFLQDNAAAVRWARDHAAQFGGDPSKLVLMGHSAGAHNVFSLAVEPQWLAGVGMTPRDITAVVGLSGVYSMLPLDGPREHAIFGSSTGYSEPIDHVDGPSPPMLMIIGDRDRDAEPSNSDDVAAKLHDKGGVAEVIHYPALGHSDTINALAQPSGQAPAIMDAIGRFLAAHGAAPPQA